MPHWQPDWDVDPEIEREHVELYEAVAKLEPEIMDGQRAHSVARVMRKLHERFQQHFAAEEDVVSLGAPEALTMLRDAHATILAMLDRLCQMPVEAANDRRALYAEFRDVLARHDTEVDAPLFRMGTR
jgi:hemerythrin